MLISDRSLCEIGRSCPSLVAIKLDGCGMVSDVGVCALARGCALEEIGLAGGLPSLTDFAIRVLAEERRSTLTALDLSRSRVTDAAVRALTATIHGVGPSSLRSLQLSSCTRITDAAVEAVAAGLPALTALAVDGCAGISATAVGAARTARPMAVIGF